MANQTELNVSETVDTVETYQFDPIPGYPMLNWKGKRPFQSTQYYSAQLKETYGEEVEGWTNKIYWGDNLQMMSHLLKTYRGKVDLIYIAPPFNSNADYKKRIEMKGEKIENDRTAFEEKQYTDIWTNDEYLQFMYERLILMRELLADNGSIYVHCDWRMNSYIRLILDEIFGKNNFLNEIVWYYGGPSSLKVTYPRKHDTIFFFSKTPDYFFNQQRGALPSYLYERARKDSDGRLWVDQNLGKLTDETIRKMKSEGRIFETKTGGLRRKQYLDEMEGAQIDDVWNIPIINSQANESVSYPTQEPEALLERIIKTSSNPGALVFDCFMGSGTTQAIAMKLGRRFIGADINLGAVETTTKRLLSVAMEIQENTEQAASQTFYTGIEVYNVNHYDVFRNPVEAKGLLIEALEIQPLSTGGIYDGEKDGRMVKIMPIDRIATRADLDELVKGFDYQAFQSREEQRPTAPVEKLLLVCMGHEPDLAAALQSEVSFKLDIEVMDILRDKSELEFKRESKAKIVRNNGHLIIEQFYPMNLLQKLSLTKENVEEWRELVESVKIDFNYDGAVMNPSVVDLLEGDKLVEGTYPIPAGAGTIRVKITDLLSESLEVAVE